MPKEEPPRREGETKEQKKESKREAQTRQRPSLQEQLDNIIEIQKYYRGKLIINDNIELIDYVDGVTSRARRIFRELVKT